MTETVPSEAPMSPATIVLIHGLWMTPLSWEGWVDHFQRRGHNVVTPAWPGMEGSVESLNSNPSPMKGLRIKTVLDHYEQVIRGLDSPPIIIGHSFGGAFVQVLLDRGLGCAGVGVDSAAVKGVLPLPLSTIRATLPILSNPFSRNGATGLSPKQFHYAFTNTMSEEDSLKAYQRYHVPAANRVLFEGAMANFNPKAPTKVDFHNDGRAPLLLIAGGDDHIIPVKVSRANYKLQSRSKAVTAYREFPGRSHFTVGQDGWEEVADYALDWALDPKPAG